MIALGISDIQEVSDRGRNLNLSNLDAGLLIMVQHLPLMMFSLNMVDDPMSFLSLSTRKCSCQCQTGRGDHSKTLYSLGFFSETPS